MAKFWFGLLAGLILFPLGILCYLLLGLAPVATTATPMPFERLIADTALQNRLTREGSGREPDSFTTDDLLNGVVVYQKNCAVCHGSYQRPGSSMGQAMFPPAPQLLKPAETVTDHPVGVIYWEVQNGIRLSGMPGFESILEEKEKWNVSALLTRMNMLPAEVEQAFTLAPDSVPGSPAYSKERKRKPLSDVSVSRNEP